MVEILGAHKMKSLMIAKRRAITFFFTFLSIIFITNLSFARVIDRIIAIVDKNIILESDLKALQKNIKHGVLFDIEYAQFFGLDKLKKDSSTQLNYLISEHLFVNFSKKNGTYSTIKRDLDKEIKKIAQANGLDISDFQSEIEKQGVSYSDYRSFILKSLIRKKIVDQKISTRIQISESDIIQFLLQKGSTSFKPQYAFTLSHIVVSVDTPLKPIIKTLKREGFKKALKYSFSPEKKGLLGTFKENELSSAFKDPVRHLKISEVSPPITVGSQIFFVRLDDKKRINELPNTPEVKQAQMSLIKDAIMTEFKAWLEEQKQTSHIVKKL